MIETGLIAGLVEGVSQQSLPEAQATDVRRFQDVMSGNSQATSTSIQPQSVEDTSVLQFVDPNAPVSTSGVTDKLINMATKMDSDYHSLLDRFSQRPGFDQYLSASNGVNSESEMLTYPAVNIDAPDSNPYEAAMKSMQDVQNASLEYQRDMNDWALGFRMWSTGVDIVASAAKKVSQGFQTLFRASG